MVNIVVYTVMALAISCNYFWGDYTFYKWGVVSTSNW